MPVPMQIFMMLATVAANPPSCQLSPSPSSLRSLGRGTGESNDEEDDSRCRIRMAAPLCRSEDGDSACSWIRGGRMCAGSEEDEEEARCVGVVGSSVGASIVQGDRAPVFAWT